MAFQGGAINAGGFLACHRFVSHTTGFATNFGTEVALGHVRSAFGLLTVPVFFLMGSMISAFFVDRRLALARTPRYDGMFAFISLAMAYIAIAGSMGSFGLFGEPMNLTADYGLLALLCLCSGIQNATITSASGAVVRTTHLTGVTTDLGIGLVRALGADRNQNLRTHEKRANWMRIGLVASFIAGSTCAAFIFYQFQYWGFLAPALISLCLMTLTIWKKPGVKGSGVDHARAS